jgi:hypothetical protein
MNVILANPDYDKIRQSGFSDFVYMDAPSSYICQSGEDLVPILRQAESEGVAEIQLHGREHVNSWLWLRDLREGHPSALAAFRHRYYAIRRGNTRPTTYLTANWATNAQHLDDIKTSIREGIVIFEHLFGKPPTSFTPCNYAFPSELEHYTKSLGITQIQTQRGYLQPSPETGSYRKRRPFLGQRSRSGQWLSVRNVAFEPFDSPNIDVVPRTLRMISRAFKAGNPAIVCTHRANYVSTVSSKNRDRALRQLQALLSGCLKQWPDIEFISSTGLQAALANQKVN